MGSPSRRIIVGLAWGLFPSTYFTTPHEWNNYAHNFFLKNLKRKKQIFQKGIYKFSVIYFLRFTPELLAQKGGVEGREKTPMI